MCNADYTKHPNARLFLEYVELGWISFAAIENKLSGETVDEIVNPAGLKLLGVKPVNMVGSEWIYLMS